MISSYAAALAVLSLVESARLGSVPRLDRWVTVAYRYVYHLSDSIQYSEKLTYCESMVLIWSLRCL